LNSGGTVWAQFVDGEFASLTDLGITEIVLDSDEVATLEADDTVHVFGMGEFTMNGQTEVFADAALEISSMGFRENADGSLLRYAA